MDSPWSLVNTQTNRRVTLSAKDWPVLIHGSAKSGAQFCAAIITADLIRRNEPVVFVSAHATTIQTLKRELNLHQAAVKYHQVTSAAATSLEDMQLVSLFQRRGTDTVASLRALKDWGERTVVIADAEDVLSHELWAVVQPHTRLVLVGDLRKITIDLDPEIFRTQILFSQTPVHWLRKRSSIPSYIGDVYQGKKHFTAIARQVANPTNLRYH